MKDHQDNQDIESKLSLLQEVPERNADQAAAGRAKFLARAEALRAAGARTPVPGSRRQRVPAARKRWLPALAGILTALLLALGSVGGTVYASQGSLPDDFLYPVKTFVEDTQLRLENDPREKLDLETAFARRRIQEIDALVKEGRDVPEKTARRLESHLEGMLQQAARMQNQGRGDEISQVQFALQEMNQVIHKLQTSNPGLGQEALNQAREKIQRGLEEAGKGPQDSPPGQDQGQGNQDQAPGQDPDSQPGDGPPENPGQGSGSREEHPGKGNQPGQDNEKDREEKTPPGQDPEFTPGNGPPHQQ